MFKNVVLVLLTYGVCFGIVNPKVVQRTAEANPSHTLQENREIATETLSTFPFHVYAVVGGICFILAFIFWIMGKILNSKRLQKFAPTSPALIKNLQSSFLCILVITILVLIICKLIINGLADAWYHC